MRGRTIIYSADELSWIEAHRRLPRREAHVRFIKVFKRPDVSLANFIALCKRRGWTTGRSGRFEPGQTPHNKGQKGQCAPGSEKGWFKPGNRSGRAHQKYRPIGTERVSRAGYVERKIHDGLPLQSRWKAVHRIRWEETNGPVPEGHALKCLDGDKTNTAPENWIAIPRALLPRLAGRWAMSYDDAPADLKPTLLAIAQLAHAVRESKK